MIGFDPFTVSSPLQQHLGVALTVWGQAVPQEGRVSSLITWTTLLSMGPRKGIGDPDLSA